MSTNNIIMLRCTPVHRPTTVCSARSPQAKITTHLGQRLHHMVGTSLVSLGLAATLATGVSACYPGHTTVVHHSHTGSAYANDGPSKVTEFAASGLIFKDSVEVVSFADPDGEE